MGNQTEIAVELKPLTKPLTVIIGKTVDKSLLLHRWASAAANDAVYLPVGRACAADGFSRLKLTKGAELLLRDIGVELYAAPSAVYVKTQSGRVTELTHAPPSIKEVVAAVLALSSDDFRRVFIEEPEAHLHPSAQRIMARVIAEAVNRGKYVALTTNSDYLISEFNNLIALSSASEGLRKRLGYSYVEVLRPEMIAVYLVKNDGAVERLEVDGSGIPEDEFTAVAEEILRIRNELY